MDELTEQQILDIEDRWRYLYQIPHPEPLPECLGGRDACPSKCPPFAYSKYHDEAATNCASRARSEALQ